VLLALGLQVKDLELTQATFKVDLDAAFGAMQQLEAAQQQDAQRIADEVAALQQQLQEAELAKAGAGAAHESGSSAARKVGLLPRLGPIAQLVDAGHAGSCHGSTLVHAFDFALTALWRVMLTSLLLEPVSRQHT